MCVMRLGRSIKRGCVTARDERVIFPVVSDSNSGWGLRGSWLLKTAVARLVFGI